jgi:hypothetical protein
MPSTVFVLAALNLYVIFLCSHRFFTNPPNRLLPAMLNATLIPVFSGLSLYLLYRGILPVMRNIIKQETKPGPPFFRYMNRLLIDWGINVKDSPGTVILYGLLSLSAIALVSFIVYTIRKRLFKNLLLHLDMANPATLITGVTILSFVMMFVYRNILNKGLGYPRNQIYMIPLTFLCIGMLFDRFYSILLKKQLKQIVMLCITVLFVGLTVHNSPSFYGASNKTCSKAVLDELRKINPEKTWIIRLSRKMRNWPRPFYYYNRYGYKTVLHRHAKQYPYDITLWSYLETPDLNAVYLNREYLLKHYRVYVTVNNPQLKTMLKQQKQK